jgi:hypothetical protein
VQLATAALGHNLPVASVRFGAACYLRRNPLLLTTRISSASTPDMATPSEIAEKFSQIDAHDDTVEGFSFHPAAKRGAKSKVTVALFRHWQGTRRTVTFSDCQNVDFVIDCEVLRDNMPNSTCVLEATAELDSVEAVMRRHRRSWNVSYDKSIDPMPAKLESATNSVLFRVRLFGGTLVVIARTFSIKRLPTRP